MKIYPAFFQMKRFVMPILLISIGCISFESVAMASQQSFDAQILRAAKIARDTGTNMTIIRETITVNVYGTGKKSNKTVQKTVVHLSKPKNTAIKIKPKLTKSKTAIPVKVPLKANKTLKLPVLEKGSPLPRSKSSGLLNAPILEIDNSNGFY